MPMDDAEVGRMVGEVSISYTIRDLLARIEERQVRTDEKIGQLASHAEVEALAVIVSRHEARWNRMIGASVAVSVLAGGSAGYLAQMLAATS